MDCLAALAMTWEDGSRSLKIFGTALCENADEISVTVAGIRAAGVIPLGDQLGSA